MSSCYHISMCLIERIKDKVPIKRKLLRAIILFISGCVSSIPLNWLDNQEQSLLKLFFFPLAYRCLVDKLRMKGVIPDIKHGSVLGYVLSAGIIGFVWTMEKYSDSPAMKKAVDMYVRESHYEQRVHWN